MTVRLETALLDSLPKAVAAAALEVALAGATATVRDARAQIQEQVGSGVKYSGLPNQSSAAGEAPVDQSGGLVDTIRTDQEDVQGIGANALAGDGSGQAFALEAGTSNMEPRPFMGPAVVVGTAAVEMAVQGVAKTLGRA